MEIPISIEDFEKSLVHKTPPDYWSSSLKCLWYDAKNDWNSAHNIAQDLHTEIGSWLHAYLHRKDGDEWNAKYWYKMAHRPYPKSTLHEEFVVILMHILNND